MKTSPYSLAHPSWIGCVGVARTDITPPLGIYARNWGAASHDVPIGIHRPLTLTALTLQETPQSPPLVLLAADLGWFRSRETEWFVRGAILETLGLDESRLMFCLSHTHAGPVLSLHEQDKPGGELLVPYLEDLARKATDAIGQALSEAQESVLDWCYGHCQLATQRDLSEPETTRYLTGFNPQGDADTTLLVGRVTNVSGDIRATLVNYACHPTTLAWQNEKISPDYVGALRQVVEGNTDSAPCLFLQGASGELAPRQQYTADVETADQHGRTLGHAVLSALQSMQPPHTEYVFSRAVESGAPLAVWESRPAEPNTSLESRLVEIELPLKDWPTSSEIETQIDSCENRAQRERLMRRLHTRRSLGDEKTTKIPLWVWQIGDAFLVGQANEAYSLWQREVRAAFSSTSVAVMNIINGWYGYLPPRDLYDNDMYSVWQTPFECGGLEKLIETSIRTIEEMTYEQPQN